MDTRIIKGLIALACLAYTVFLFVDGSIVSGIFMLLLTAIVGVLVFRSVRMILAFLQVRQQKMDKAKKWLDRINPDHLWKNQRGYYYFLMGSANADQASFAQSEKYFRQALSSGLKMDHDKAMVYLNLAVLTANKRKKREALNLLNEAKRFDTKGYLKDQIKQVNQAVSRI